jgi:hypothetical protein
MKPRPGRQTFNVEVMSPLTGLLDLIYRLRAINISPLTGLE